MPRFSTSFSVSIPSSSFPLKSAVWHCHSCRHTTGQLFATWAVIPAPLPLEFLDHGNLVKYAVSTCERWFCKRCGASVVNIDRAGEEVEWEVATGVLSFENEKGLHGKLNRVQLWIEDVKGDGGAAGWINQGRLAGTDRHWNGRDSEMVSDERVKDLMKPQDTLMETATNDIWCSANVKMSASTSEDQQKNTIMGLITAWMTVRKDHIVVDSDLESFLADESRLGQYESPKNISRYFCVGCGATVFYCKHNVDTIDIATGLMESKIEGTARVDRWLTWFEPPDADKVADRSLWAPGFSFQEDAVDASFVKGLADGMESWGKENPKT